MLYIRLSFAPPSFYKHRANLSESTRTDVLSKSAGQPRAIHSISSVSVEFATSPERLSRRNVQCIIDIIVYIDELIVDISSCRYCRITTAAASYRTAATASCRFEEQPTGSSVPHQFGSARSAVSSATAATYDCAQATSATRPID